MVTDTEKMTKIAKSFANDVKQVMPVEKAVLFGSWAKGYATELSDVDICFFITDYQGKERYEVIAELLGMGRKYPEIGFEPLVFQISEIENGNPFVREVLTTGIELL